MIKKELYSWIWKKEKFYKNEKHKLLSALGQEYIYYKKKTYIIPPPPNLENNKLFF